MTGEVALPNTGLLHKWTVGSDGWAPGMDDNIAKLDVLMFLRVKSASLTNPSTLLPELGQRWIVAAPGDGAWENNSQDIAVWTTAGWSYFQPKPGWKAYDEETQAELVFNGTAWISAEMPYDIYVYRETLNTAPLPILSLVFPRTVTFRANMEGCSARLRVATTLSKTLSLTRDGTQFSLLSFGAGTAEGTFGASPVVTFEAGQELQMFPPATVDATMAGLKATLAGYR